MSFVSPRPSTFPKAKPRGTLRVENNARVSALRLYCKISCARSVLLSPWKLSSKFSSLQKSVDVLKAMSVDLLVDLEPLSY